MTPDEVIAVVLAAGGSSRLGRAKQLVDHNGKTLIGGVLDCVEEVRVPRVVVVTGGYRDVVAARLPPDVVEVFNPDWRKGLGSSIAAGVAAVTATVPQPAGLLLLLADQPLVTASHLGRLIRCVGVSDPLERQRIDHVVASATRYPGVGGGLGVPALFHISLAGSLAELDGDRGAQSLLNDDDLAVAGVDPDYDPVDIDTEADIQSLQKTGQPDL